MGGVGWVAQVGEGIDALAWGWGWGAGGGRGGGGGGGTGRGHGADSGKLRRSFVGNVTGLLARRIDLPHRNSTCLRRHLLQVHAIPPLELREKVGSWGKSTRGRATETNFVSKIGSWSNEWDA